MTISANYPTVAPTLNLDFANSQSLDPRINFQRGTTGTYYDGETSVVAEQNLFLWSQDFSNAAWQKTSLTSSGPNQASAPDGTSTSNLMTEASNTTLHRIQQSSASVGQGQSVTLSMYLKAGTTNFVYLEPTGTSLQQAIAVDLSTGTQIFLTDSTNVSSPNFSIINAGSGWYRVSITVFPPVATTVTLYTGTCSGNGGTRSTTGGNTYYAWGAQAEARAFITPYTTLTTTTTATVTNYIPQLLTAVANQPRFDFNPVTRQSLGLLMEQSSTNLLTYSSDYTQSVWTKNNTSAVPATNISPDGTLNAQSIVENTATTTHQLQVGTSQASNTTVTASIFFKSNGRPVFNITVVSADFSGNFSAFFNATTGLVGTTASAGTGTFSSATMTSVGNGWYRCRISGQPSTTASTTRIHTSFGDTEALTTSGYTGNGASGIYAWGAQLEATAFPTSYIPTVASTVTRAQDFATITGTNFSSWFNNQQGTVYCSFDMATLGAPNMNLWGIDNTATLGYMIQKTSATLQAYQNNGGIVFTMGTIPAIPTGSSYSTTQQSVYTFNNTSGSLGFSGTLNGGTVGSTTPLPLYYIPTQLSLGKYIANTGPMTGHIRKFAYYPIASTSAQMQALTGS